MNYRLPILMSCALLMACSQIDVPEEEPDGGSAAPTANRNSADRTSSSVAPSQQREYRKTYNLFKVHHRNVFDLVNENRLALRNEGQKSVQAVEDLFSMLSDQNQSALEDVRDRYQDAWENFDQRSPSVGERNRLRNAGDQVKRQFNPDNVQLKVVEVSEPSQSDDEASESEQQTVGKETAANEIKVRNPSRYRALFNRWQEAHQQFQAGIESNDPLLQSSFEEVKTALNRMIEQIKSGKDKLKNYYLSQYELIYSRRDEFAGTPAKTDHLTYLRRQLEREFAPASR